MLNKVYTIYIWYHCDKYINEICSQTKTTFCISVIIPNLIIIKHTQTDIANNANKRAMVDDKCVLLLQQNTLDHVDFVVWFA